MRHLLVVLVGIPAFWHLLIVAGTVYDAGRAGMSRWKWGTIALVVPLFGAFAYLLERSDRHTDEDIYDDGTYNVYEPSGGDRDTGVSAGTDGGASDPVDADGTRGHDRPPGGGDDRRW